MNEQTPLKLSSDYGRFQSLWNACLIPHAQNDSFSVYQFLLKAYAEPQRFYHTRDHIEHCLVKLDEVIELLENPAAVELAIWFHDVIYKPGNSGNERRSAETFQKIGQQVLSEEILETVSGLILDTLHAECVGDNRDSQFMVDIDLSSFGLPWEEFFHDSSNLRKEMKHLSEVDYLTRQMAFQKTLLAKPRFYRTDYFFNQLENQARQNLTRYFKIIESKIK